MSAANGSVGIEVQVPVLGTLAATRTLKDLIAGVPNKPPVEGPAVTVRDPDARTLAALNAASAAPAPSAPPPAAVVAEAPAAPTPAPPAAATPAEEDPEAEANTMLQFAENFLRANMKIKAILKYEEIVKKYPQTAAGKTAKAKLEALGE